MDIDALVQEKLEADIDFITNLDSLSDEERETAIRDKKSEIMKQEFATLAEKAKKDEQIARDQKIRAEKAEQAAKQAKPEEKKEESDLSQKDVLVLAKANVHDDDLEEVIEFAKFKKISIAEALQNSTLKTILADKDEFRKTAEASNTKNSKRTIAKVTDDTLIADLAKGKVPEKGSEEAEALFWARRGGKR